ncbi:pseudouridine synthase [Lachnotalea glycerini]|uniref:Pseudouridine synthase n=1 Tax=Lachnotalea glycerini TaxID=1763509 RepID=A0A371JGG7_9FIRM|nr:pseudouridine synthase [Lachnotalea glycerini]RDY31818.1 rRNA pseudouridine synthase [Lachnotalea glycerini]
MRLDKYLAETSVGRRKEVRILIKDKKIQVNGEIELLPAAEIDEENDIIEYLNHQIKYTRKVYYMFHKPAGCVTARKDLKHTTVLDYFQDVDNNCLFPVGRLDKDTEGLLFITNDGEFNHHLMHPKKHVNKTYFFWAFGELSIEKIQQLEDGIELDSGDFITKKAKLEILRTGLFKELKVEMKENLNDKIKKNRDIQPVISGYLTISEGCKHQVKRMLKAVGCYVIYLRRISIGNVALDDSLKKGDYRELTYEEIELLMPKKNKEDK